jgi:hypothetical protein
VEAALKWEGEPCVVLSLRTPERTQMSRGAGVSTAITASWRRSGKHAGRPPCFRPPAPRWRKPARPPARSSLGVTLDYRVTQEECRLLSLYVDAVERSTGRPLTVRTADTWDLASGVPHLLTDFLPPTRLWRQSLLAETDRTVRSPLQSGDPSSTPMRRPGTPLFFPAALLSDGNSLAVFLPHALAGRPPPGIRSSSCPVQMRRENRIHKPPDFSALPP